MRLSLIVLLAILIGQLAVVYVLPALGVPRWQEALVAAGVMVGLVGPMLYVAVVRPLGRARAELAAKVAERTAELSAVNQKLAWWVQQLEERSRQILCLSELVPLMEQCGTVTEAAPHIAGTLDRLFRGESWALYVWRVESQQMEALGRAGEAAPEERAFAADACLGLRSGQPHVAAPGGETCPHLGRPPSGTYMCAPIGAQGEAIGVLHLVHAGTSLDDARRVLAVVVAEHLGLSLANLRLREELRAQAVRDALTGLFNRRYMEESLDRELRRAARRQVPLGVIMIDIDHFKGWNDKHGHAAGDALLREVGAFLKTHVRAEDIACRYGGEEFALIMPEAPVENLLQRAEDLRKGVQKIMIQQGSQALGGITMSLGVAAYPTHGATGEAVLKAADMALYRAKSEGRNRVSLASMGGTEVRTA